LIPFGIYFIKKTNIKHCFSISISISKINFNFKNQFQFQKSISISKNNKKVVVLNYNFRKVVDEFLLFWKVCGELIFRTRL